MLNVFAQRRKKSIREISSESRASALKVGISLVPGDKQCSLCRTHLQKLSVQAPKELPTLVDLPIPGPSTAYLNEEFPLSVSTTSTSDDSVVHGVDIEDVQ